MSNDKYVNDRSASTYCVVTSCFSVKPVHGKTSNSKKKKSAVYSQKGADNASQISWIVSTSRERVKAFVKKIGSDSTSKHSSVINLRPSKKHDSEKNNGTCNASGKSGSKFDSVSKDSFHESFCTTNESNSLLVSTRTIPTAQHQQVVTPTTEHSSPTSQRISHFLKKKDTQASTVDIGSPSMEYSSDSLSHTDIPSLSKVIINDDDVICSKEKSTFCSSPCYRIFILLLHVSTRRFELVEIEYNPDITTIGNLIAIIPSTATDSLLGLQNYLGFCCPDSNTEMIELTTLAAGSEKLGGHKIQDDEVVIAIPEKCSGEEVRRIFKKKLMKHPKLKNVLSFIKSGNKCKKSKRRVIDKPFVPCVTVKENEELSMSRHSYANSVKSIQSEDVVDEMTDCESLITVDSTADYVITRYTSLNLKNDKGLLWSNKAFNSFLMILLSAGGGGEASLMGARSLIVCAALFKYFCSFQENSAARTEYKKERSDTLQINDQSQT